VFKFRHRALQQCPTQTIPLGALAWTTGINDGSGANLELGYEVTVFDINAENPAVIASSASFIVLGVGYDNEVNKVTFGESGILTTLAPGAIVAVSSTVAPATVRSLDELLRAKGSCILAAPICRSRWFADEGKLLALFDGTNPVMERGRAVYSCFASDITHLGDVGHGQIGKAINNLALWTTSIGLIEAGKVTVFTGIEPPL
jgi:3-hydroxyisobutyrate dehydrogenase-like beta-hydroxyacid dehydrogenase